jgi:hypothetical protein
MVGLCSPRLEEYVGFIGINVDVWGTLDDVEEDMWAAPVLGHVVLVLGVIPEVIGVCVTAGNGGDLVLLSSSLLISMDKVLPEGVFIGILLVDGEAAVLADPLHVGLVVVVAVALFCMMDVDAVCPIILALGDSEATTSAKVEGGVSNDPSAITAVIAGTGVEVVLSLQSCLRFGTSLSVCCSWR